MYIYIYRKYLTCIIYLDIFVLVEIKYSFKMIYENGNDGLGWKEKQRENHNLWSCV